MLFLALLFLSFLVAIFNMDHEKFSHLPSMQLMQPKKNTVMGVIELEPHKWLREGEKEGLLNLL